MIQHSHKTVLIAFLLFGCLLAARPANAEVITWHWTGEVDGYRCSGYFSPCLPSPDRPSLDEVIPLGTAVDVFLTFASDFPTYPNADNPCLMGTATASVQLLGRTYTSTGFVWDDADGDGGVCIPSVNQVQVVVPGWGGNLAGPALPDGWGSNGHSDRPFYPGLYWFGDLEQPTSIAPRFPMFGRPFITGSGQAGSVGPQTFTANLQAVTPIPEPATMTMLGAGLAALIAKRRRFRRAGDGN